MRVAQLKAYNLWPFQNLVRVVNGGQKARLNGGGPL